MELIIKKILEIAVLAPSGDNAQPWEFSINGDELFVYNIPNADHSVYNFMERGSFVSHGALLENIAIVSHSMGYESNMELFPDKNKTNLTARIRWKQAIVERGLSEAIPVRCTNRKLYRRQELSSHDQNELLSIKLEDGLSRFQILEDRPEILKLSNIINLNERIFLENYYVHKGLFSFIRWSREEEIKYGNGLFIKTLELGSPQEFMMKLFRFWPVMNIFNKFNFAALVAKDTAKLYSSSSAFGVITTKNKLNVSFIATGRMLQKIWLKATAINLSLQPTAALLYLAQRIEEEGIKLFSNKHAELIIDAEKRIREIFNLPSDEIPTMLFRIGYADVPTARSFKHPYILTNKNE